MASLFGMGFDMTWDTQQFDVVGIVTELLHLHNGAATFHRSDVVAVHAWRVDALLEAHLAQSVGTPEHRSAQQLPLLVVQQSLVVLVSAHTLIL